MGSLLGLVLPWWARWVVLALLMAGVAGYAAFKMHQHDQIAYDELDREFDDFKAKVAAEGQAAQQRAATQAKIDKSRKENADAQLTLARDAAAVANRGWLQLAQSRAGSGYLPAASATAADPDRACFSRAELERTLGRIDAAGAGLAAEGDEARLGLDNARRWGQGRGP